MPEVPEPAEPRVSTAGLVSWSRQDSSWGPAKTNPFVTVRSQTGLYSTRGPGAEGKLPKPTAPALPSLCPSGTSSGPAVSELWWENRGWGRTDLAMADDFLLPAAGLLPGKPRGGGTAGSVGILRSQTPAWCGGRESAGNAQAGTGGDEE